MEQYISKSALVAEIEKRIKVSQDYAKCNLTEKTRIGNHAQQLELNDILSFINTLEVKEVDLEKEIEEVKHNYKIDDNRHTSICSADIEWLAKHFYELGLKAQKGE